MPRMEIHSDDLKIDQKPPILDPANYDGDIIVGERVIDKEYADELAFNEEPVTIRLEPSADKNAAGAFPIWVNGKPAEVWQGGRWEEIGYLPVGRTLTVKRKVLEVLIRAKHDTVHTEVREPESDHPDNRISRFTASAQSFSIIEDRNPNGPAWVQELRRRNI